MDAQRPAWASWDPQSTAGYASAELALVEALDCFGPAFARWVNARAAGSGPTSYPLHRWIEA